MSASGNATTPVPPFYKTPSFPSLYWLIGPLHVVNPAYLYHIRDIWRFTLFWTLIIFEAAHLAAGTFAVVVVWWGGREHRSGLGMGRTKSVVEPPEGEEGNRKGRSNDRPKRAGMKGTGFSGMWIVPVVYGGIAAIEGVLAGSVVGLL